MSLSICNAPVKMPRPIQDFPLVIFSPGMDNSRLLYSAMAKSTASFGYIVVNVNHSYGAAFVEYPVGTITMAANISSDAHIILDVDTRAKD
jgi:hypothetical protein